MSARPVHIITGAAGFIGSNIAAALSAEADIVAVDWLDTDLRRRNLSGVGLADIVPPEQCFDALAKIGDAATAIIHMGAISSTTASNAGLVMQTNFDLPCRLWDWCARAGVPFFYASSAATYGDGSHGFDDRDDPEHLSRLQPLNLYGWSKHLFDRWVADRVAGGGPSPPRWAGLKFFNVFGPNEFHKGPQRSVALQLFEQIARGEPVKLFASDNPDYPDGGQKRDFVWIGDCVDIVRWFIEAPRKSGIYNGGSGMARSFSDLAECIFRAMDRPSAIQYVPMPEGLKTRYQYFTCAKMEKLVAAGYSKPLTSLEEGTRRYVQDYLITHTASGK